MIKRMENGTSEERLKGLWWFSLKKRRLRGDLITAFKYMTGYYKGDANNLFSITREDRGNCLKLQREKESKRANSARRRTKFLTGPDYIKGGRGLSFPGELFTQTTHSPWWSAALIGYGEMEWKPSDLQQSFPSYVNAWFINCSETFLIFYFLPCRGQTQKSTWNKLPQDGYTEAIISYTIKRMQLCYWFFFFNDSKQKQQERSPNEYHYAQRGNEPKWKTLSSRNSC